MSQVHTQIECNFLAAPFTMTDNENSDGHVSEDEKAEYEANPKAKDRYQNVNEDIGKSKDQNITEDTGKPKDKNVTKDTRKPKVQNVTEDTRKPKDQNVTGDTRKPDDQNATESKPEDKNNDKSNNPKKVGESVTINVERTEVQFKNRPKESDVDSGKVVNHCEKCIKLKEENKRLTEILNQTLEESEKHAEKLQNDIKYFKEQKKFADERYRQIKERSDEITASMADVFETKVEFENINDEVSNSKLTKRIERVYSNKWPSLTEWLYDNIDGLDEITMIKHLTLLMKKTYETCTNITDKEIRVFLALEDDEPIPTPQENPLLYKVKRNHGRTEKRRKALRESIWKVLSNDVSVNDLLGGEQNKNKGEGTAKLEDFFKDFADICWLVSISQPKLILDFNVTGKVYEGNLRDRFKQYACQETVRDESRVKNTIIEVVWPSLELEDGSGIYSKGDVIVVEEGLNEEAASETKEDADRDDDNSENTADDEGTSSRDTGRH